MHLRRFVPVLAFTVVMLTSVVASATIIIDDFVRMQTTVASAGGPLVAFNTATAPPGQILGGERDVRVEVENGIGDISLRINAFGANLLTYNEDAQTSGNSRITWDGVDGSEDLDATGLGGLDFTESGLNTEILLQGVTTDLPIRLSLFAYTDATNFSSFGITLPALVVVPEDFSIPFSDFGIEGGAGADFTNIGAFRLAIDTLAVAAVDLTIDSIVIPSRSVPEPSPLFVIGAGLLGLFGTYRYRRR